jgi:hypothetical protein
MQVYVKKAFGRGGPHGHRRGAARRRRGSPGEVVKGEGKEQDRKMEERKIGGGLAGRFACDE